MVKQALVAVRIQVSSHNEEVVREAIEIPLCCHERRPSGGKPHEGSFGGPAPRAGDIRNRRCSAAVSGHREHRPDICTASKCPLKTVEGLQILLLVIPGRLRWRISGDCSHYPAQYELNSAQISIQVSLVARLRRTDGGSKVPERRVQLIQPTEALEYRSVFGWAFRPEQI